MRLYAAAERGQMLMLFITDLFLVLTQNVLFTYVLGVPSIIKSSQKRGWLLFTGLLVTFFTTVNSVLLAWIRPIIPADYASLLLPFFCALLCGLLDMLILLVLAGSCGTRAHKLIPHLHAAAFSSAVLGALLLSYDAANSVHTAMRYGFRCGLGYLLACGMLAVVVPVVNSEKMPAAVRGWRGLFLYAGVIAMATACISAGTA